MESILTSIKKLLGITEEYDHFDVDIIMHINTVFMTLNQMGVGPSKVFSISDKYSTWDEFIPEDDENFGPVKSYMYMKVKLLFDPPLSSTTLSSYERLITELEWRLHVAAETPEEIQNGD